MWPTAINYGRRPTIASLTMCSSSRRKFPGRSRAPCEVESVQRNQALSPNGRPSIRRQCDRVLELNRRFELAHIWKGWALDAVGRPAEAVASMEEPVRLSGGATFASLSLAYVLASSGSRDSAVRVLARVQEKNRAYVPSYEIAKVDLALGDHEEA